MNSAHISNRLRRTQKKRDTSTMKNQSGVLYVILPDDTELSMTVGFKDRGRDVLKQLLELIGTSGLLVFGLSVVKDNQPLFLDLEQKLSSYLPKSWRKNALKEKVYISLKVQYFIKNVEVILNREACKLYYAELKRRVLRSECFEQEGLYFQLAAYALQADLGDCEEHNHAYFSAHGFFPLWIVQKHGNDYILKHTPDLHRELKGMSPSEAALLFMQESFTLSDVPLTMYRLSKEKNKPQDCILMGVASTGLQISEMLNGEQQSVCDLPWPFIHSITFQGRKFDIRANGLHEKKLVLYSLSVLHAKSLLQHISNSHRLHLNTKPLVMRLKGKNGRHREMYITDGDDLDMDDSDDELPTMKFLLGNVQKQTTGTSECRTVTGSDSSNGSCCLEMSVDEPEEMFVDDPEEVLRLIELVEGVSVDGPLFLPVSQWKGTCNNFTVAFIETAEKVSCFKVMDGHGAVCWTGHPTQSCQIDYRDGKTCIKWPVDNEIQCVKDTSGMLNTEELKKCARDQKSISCNGEYESDSLEIVIPGNSASTLSLSILPITAVLSIIFVHWVSLWLY